MIRLYRHPMQRKCEFTLNIFSFFVFTHLKERLYVRDQVFLVLFKGFTCIAFDIYGFGLN